MTLRTIAASEDYESAYLYEIVLSKVGGEGNIRNEKEFFIDVEEKGFFSLSWTLVKTVFFYLLKKQFDYETAKSLYDKIICELEFNLLISSFDKYKQLEPNHIKNRLQYQFLLHEMCNKVAYDTVNCLEKKKKIIVNSIVEIQETINDSNQNLHKQERSKKSVKALTFQHKNFGNALPEKLKDLKFIKENITDNTNSLTSKALRKQFLFDAYNIQNGSKNICIVEFNQILDEISQFYGFNRVIQIFYLIENFVLLSVQHNGFQISCKQKITNVETAQILMRIANVYYNCCAILISELYPDENCTYEPIYYTKLVLILFSLFAMMDDLARSDEKIGSSLKEYTLSIDSANISLKSIMPQLTLPERKWLDLLKKIDEKFELSTTDVVESPYKRHCLFHHSSLSIDNKSDETNTDVMYMLSLLKNDFPDNYTKFQETLKGVKSDQLKARWEELLFTDKYLPELIIYLRDISYLAQLSLCGFSQQAIRQIRRLPSSDTKMYNRLKHNFDNHLSISHLDIQINSSVDKMRFVDFILPRNQSKYQTVITFNYDQQNITDMTENTIIGLQNKKPDNLTKPQYYRLCSIQLHDELKFTFLYIALKYGEINFELEEHCYLVKQALYKIGIHENICLIEKQLQNEEFIFAFVKKIVDIVLDLKERMTQYKSMGHGLDILLFLYDFCSKKPKILIDKCLEEVRVSFLNYIDQNKNNSKFSNDKTLESLLSCYYILTYKISNNIDHKIVLQLLKLRELIDSNSKLYGILPPNLYVKTMETLFKLSSHIESNINKNLSMLDNFIEKSNGSWKKDIDMNVYVKDCYSFIPLKGRLFKNGHPLSCLPSQILNNSHFKECYGTKNFSAQVTDQKIFEKILRCYEIKCEKSRKIRIVSLQNNSIWIEDNGETFISRDYLSKLPKFLLEDCTHIDNEKKVFYSHWYKDNKIFIKNDKEKKFTIDFNTNEIYAHEYEKYLVPFSKDGFDQSNIFYTIFSQFEDENYIIALKDRDQDSEPIMLDLPRLNLKFKIENKKIISENFKDYRLSLNQHVKTLLGLPQYLLIEPDISCDQPIKFNQKIIIPYHPIKQEKEFYTNVIQFDSDKVGKPGYFSYEIDEHLKWLNSETIAGSLYLALLYFKTATLDKDVFLEMNGFETCSIILKTCWQNCQYSDTEFNIILKFFEHNCSDLEKPWSHYADKGEEIFKNATYGSIPHHRNAHAIFLRLVYLLLSSYQADFLIKVDNKKKELCHYFLSQNFVKYHFNFYLIFKDRIDRRCRLSDEEEKKLLLSCVGNCSDSRVSDYYKVMCEKKDLELVMNAPKDYKSLEDSFFSRTSIKECQYEKQVADAFKKHFPQSYRVHCNKMCSVQNLFSDWVKIRFELSYFVSLYRMALSIQSTDDFNTESFAQFLAYLFLTTDDTDQVFIRMLYIVCLVPKSFRPVPNFLSLETGEINCDRKYHLDSNSMKLCKNDIPHIFDLDGNINEKVKICIWTILKNEYLNEDEQSKFNVNELINHEFKVKFQTNVKTIFKKQNISSISNNFYDTLYDMLITKSRNKELYEFFINTAKQCQTIVASYKIGYTVRKTTGLSEVRMKLSIKDIENQIRKVYPYSESNEDYIRYLEWTAESIDIKEHYESLRKLFDFEYDYPTQIDFPLNPKTLPENSLVRKVFSERYGKEFIADLEESYGRQESIVKIDENYFKFSMKESKTGFCILEESNVNLEEEFNYLEYNLDEIKNDLFIDVEQWIENESSKTYVPQHHLEKIIDLKTELNDKLKKINKALIDRNILSQRLTLEPLKQKLEKLKSDINFKREANRCLVNLNNVEAEIEDFIIENDNLFKGYLTYHREKRIISPSILKLICKRRYIGISVYEKLDTSSFELKTIDNYSYITSKCKKQLQYWLNQGKFCQIETEEIKDHKILKSLNSKSTVEGYLQTRKIKIDLKSKDINNFTNILYKYYIKYKKINEDLLKEIRKNLSSIANEFDETNMFVLHRIVGDKPVPTRKETLALLKNINKIKEFNPFVIDQKDTFNKKIECYAIQKTLIQQIERTLVLISKYNSLHPDNDIDERERILETIYMNILMERSYDPKHYPSCLLFEIENNLLIREDQYSLVEKMIKKEKNSIYQLNMGEGKTSVILPILSAILADGKQIVRINCLESLMGITQELLRNKFSGLFKKKIYIMPFSRSIVFSKENVERIKEMLYDCQQGKHILLVTPEQRLCFQLKKQEIFLEYLQSKDADDHFDSDEHRHRLYTSTIKSRTPYSLTDSQKNLKEVLRSLGYIDSNDKILKYPPDDLEGLPKFSQEVIKEVNHLRCEDIKNAWNTLRAQSTKLKAQRKQKLELLHSIDDFQFFDILDESDEILCHGKELNYTLGSAKPLDGDQIRWEIPLLIFRMIFAEHKFGERLKAASERDDCPVIFQENFRPVNGIGGGSPLVRFVKPEYFVENIGLYLSQKLCERLRLRFRLKNIYITNDDSENYGTYENFVQGESTSKEDKIVKLLGQKSRDMLNSFLLVKAWLHHDILYHVMNYRYRVEYGLSENGTKQIAIPFRSKDLPSENSEFSHPDIMIGFTILSYLYRGLDVKQVKQGLINLKNDPNHNGDSLLQKWVKENKKWIDEQIVKDNDQFPEWLKSFKTLDLEDENKINKVHLYLSRNFDFIEYYLSNFIFPKDAKHYVKKLTGNAHTLAGEGKTRGFSGTDDRNDTMPESVIPERLLSQKGTNGKMLHILSRKLNSEYIPNTEITGTKEFLHEICKYVEKKKDCYVFIDAGAIIIEMSNFDVSKYLIKKIDKRFDGIVYFSDKNNKIMVILRNEESFPLSTCHIDSKKLFVYLDEAHTRGTDLKLPLTARGIVTLSKNMNKDKLMQGVMRLRDLDFKQSIVLWGSKETTADIATINDIKADSITSKHVLIWVTYNTIQKNENDLYPVTKEKLKYVIKSRALKYQKKIEIPIDSLIIAYESESLDNIEKLYGITPYPRDPRDLLNLHMSTYLNKFYPSVQRDLERKRQLKELINEINENRNKEDRPTMQNILKRIDDKLPERILTADNDYDGNQENEKEIEEMQIVQSILVTERRPEKENDWYFDRVFERNFKENCLRGEDGYPKLKELGKCFEFTNINHLKDFKWHHRVFVTENFIRTVSNNDKLNKRYQTDYLKPVNMILIHRTGIDVCFIVISAFEAKSLIPLCYERNDPNVCLMHIDDVNGPTMVPKTTIILKEKEIHSVITIRLFNGQCRYKEEEIPMLKKCVAFVDKHCLHEDKKISEQVYNELEDRDYIVHGFMTYKLASKLTNQNERILVETETHYEIDLQNRFHSIIHESIAEDVKSIWRLSSLIRKLVQIRGKSEQYQTSELRNILEMNPEKTNDDINTEDF
ncbi:unnamed protein product [Rotaria sordida]|uniref:ubiquitinyl hydrolase 1 n=1 Tax=Rotaria sordida TaxID=392033 RepID=A0A814W413_9BILA|nr:unnamed protein product [Rotaria sordida]CAF1469754.1 unnamed protein product [Rotaria sordida]